MFGNVVSSSCPVYLSSMVALTRQVVEELLRHGASISGRDVAWDELLSEATDSSVRARLIAEHKRRVLEVELCSIEEVRMFLPFQHITTLTICSYLSSTSLWRRACVLLCRRAVCHACVIYAAPCAAMRAASCWAVPSPSPFAVACCSLGMAFWRYCAGGGTEKDKKKEEEGSCSACSYDTGRSCGSVGSRASRR